MTNRRAAFCPHFLYQGGEILNDTVEKRLEALRRTLAEKSLDAFMVLKGENRRYLSGFTGADAQLDESAGALFINDNKLILATDARYDLQAADEAKGYDIFCYREGLVKAMPEICALLDAKRMGFESVRLTFKQYHEICEKLLDEKMDIRLVPTENIVEDIRIVKDADEIDKTRQALDIAEKAFLNIVKRLEPGMTEKEAAWLLEKNMREMGADALSFPSIVAAGPNSAMPHAVPGNRRIKEGEPVLFDWGAFLNGYCSDTSRTIILGTADSTFMKVFNTAAEAQRLAIQAIRAGTNSKRIDQIARDHIEKMGFGDKFGHGLGHGTGLAVHEAPALSPLKDTVLKPGMIVTVEPGIYLPEWGGVRIENQVVVREDGAEVLNRLDVGPHFL